MRTAQRLWWLLAGLALAGAGALGLVSLNQRADDIRAGNTTVAAQVLGQRNSSFGRHFKVVGVEYSYLGQIHRTDLLDIGWALPPEAGDRITLAIDPDRPSEAAGPGLVSGAAWRYWYQPVGFLGIMAVLVTMGFWIRSRWATPDEETAEGVLAGRILVHPDAAWADRADGTILTLVLVAGEQPWEEELAARHLDAQSSEICAVPFLQTRLALGDVVRVNRRGYAGAVTRPSGLVTFAVRSSEPADVHALAGEFAGTTVEEIGTDLLAIAAPAETAGRIHERLRTWEEQGRVEYRSSLRTDLDTPLI
jgi:hypothetical protein